MRIFIYNRLGNKPMKSKILLIGLALAIAAAIGLYLLMNARCYQLLGNLVCHGADERKRVALTFDDAPSERTSDAVLAVLAEKNVKATFFMIGENIERYPQAAQRIAAAGHEMGNHSYSHRRFLLRSPAFIAREIEDTNALIRTAGYHGRIHFRPPYGKKLLGLPWYLARHNITTVMWDSEPARHQAPTAEAITAAALAQAHNGAIILLHPFCAEACRAEREALPLIIDGLRAQGYTLTTVSELLK